MWPSAVLCQGLLPIEIICCIVGGHGTQHLQISIHLFNIDNLRNYIVVDNSVNGYALQYKYTRESICMLVVVFLFVIVF